MYMNPKAKGAFFMTDLSLERLPTTADELTEGTPNPEFIIGLNKALNAQAERIETMLESCGSTSEAISYADIMHWKSRFTYLRNVGEAKKANELAKKMQALEEAEEDEADTEENYKQFLQDEGLTLS